MTNKTGSGTAGSQESPGRAVLAISQPKPAFSGLKGIFQSESGNLNVMPVLSFTDIEFKPATLDSLSIPIFYVESSGLILERCLVSQFRFVYTEEELRTGAQPHGVASTTRVALQFFGSEFRNNSLELGGDDVAIVALPLFGGTSAATARFEIFDCVFQFNSVVAPTIQGGLLICRAQLVIRGSKFLFNSGTIMNYGVGLVAGAYFHCDLEVTESSFIENHFLVNARDWGDGVVGAYGVTYGAALGILPADGQLIVSQTNFTGNIATQGGAIALGMGQAVIDPDLTISWSISMLNIRFEGNNATSGVGAAILLQGSFLTLFEAQGVTFDSNLVSNLGAARKVFPGVPPKDSDAMSASVIFGTELISATLRFDTVNFHSRSHPHNPYVTHRSLISGPQEFHFTNVLYSELEITPDSSSAALLSLNDMSLNLVLSNISLGRDMILKTDADPTPNPGPFILLENIKRTLVSGLTLSEMERDGVDLSLLVARGLEKLFITDSTILNTTMNKPLLLVENCRNVFLENSLIQNFSGPFQFFNIETLSLTNAVFSTFTGTTSMIQLDQVAGPVVISQVNATSSTAPFVFATEFDGLTISDTHLSDFKIISLDGAITLIQGNSLGTNELYASDIKAVEGAVISVTLVEVIKIENSKFIDNSASQSGGAIKSDSCRRFEVRKSVFHRNLALSGDGGALNSRCFFLFIENSSFTGCKASESGGAIHASPRGTSWAEFHIISVSKSKFIYNRAGGAGGALRVLDIVHHVSDSLFLRNEAGSRGGSAAMTLPSAVSDSAYFKRCNFTSNLVNGGKGGSIDFNIDPEAEGDLITTKIEECQFQNNVAFVGGAISVSRVLNLNQGKNWFIGNSADTGGALWIHTVNPSLFPQISNQSFHWNYCEMSGAVVALDTYSRPDMYAGQLWMDEMTRLNTFIEQTKREGFPGSLFSQMPVQLFFSPLDNEENALKDIDHPMIDDDPDHKGRRLGNFRLGMPRSFLVDIRDGLDQPGVTANYTQLQWVLRLDSCEDTHGNPDERPQMTQSLHLATEADGISFNGESHRLVMSLLFTLAPLDQGSSEPLTSALSCGVFLETAYADTLLRVSLQPCGFGTGLASNSSECQTCLLGSYSFQGTCSSCAEDPHVECFGGIVRPVRNYWVDSNVTRNQYQVFRCPNGFCTPRTDEINFSPCAPTRKGVMCGECLPNLHESVLTNCISCNKPNWVMISLVIAGLWIAALILHALVAVSSGKATILIFFVQACFTINSQFSITDIFRSGSSSSGSSIPGWLAFLLCLTPLDLLDRTLLLGLVPFIMMTMLGITFSVRIAILKVISLFRSFRPDSNLYKPVPASERIILDVEVPYAIIEEDSSVESRLQRSASQIELDTDQSDQEFQPSASEAETDPNMGLDQLLDSQSGFYEKSDLDGEKSIQKLLEGQESDTSDALARWQVQMEFWHPHRLIRTFLSLLTSSFSSVLGISIATIGCVTLLDGSRVLQSAPSISCDSGRFKLFRNLNGLWISYMTILVIGLAWKLLDGYRKNALSVMDVRFGIWYEMYKPKTFFWKLSELIRRLLLSIAAKLLLSAPLTRSIALFAIAIAFLAIQMITMPYRHKLENRLETLSLTALAFVALVNIWNSHLLGVTNPPTWTFILAWAICFAVAGAIVVAIVVMKVKTKRQLKRA